MPAQAQSHLEVTRALRKATSRAKSDVANKLVSMFLHDVSRRVCSQFGKAPSDPDYSHHVLSTFGPNCPYCGRTLDSSLELVVEHPDGMNRLRAGLHVPGNVLIACKDCNREKRRDDGLQKLILAHSGWESFLAHNGKKCPPACKTCAHWETIWPDSIQRDEQLASSRKRIQKFRKSYKQFFLWIDEQRPAIRGQLDSLYRECQQFAEERIKAMVAQVTAKGPII